MRGYLMVRRVMDQMVGRGSVTRTRPLSWGERLGSPAITRHIFRPRSVLLMAGQLLQHVGGAGSSRSETDGLGQTSSGLAK